MLKILQNIFRAQVGKDGFDRVTGTITNEDTGAPRGGWQSVVAWEGADATAVLTTRTGDNYSGVIPAGQAIFGDFTSIAVSAGVLGAYRVAGGTNP